MLYLHKKYKINNTIVRLLATAKCCCFVHTYEIRLTVVKNESCIEHTYIHCNAPDEKQNTLKDRNNLQVISDDWNWAAQKNASNIET